MAKSKVFLRDQYNYDVDVVSRETGLKCEDKSRALQSEKEDSNINTIVKRFGLTGVLPQGVRLPSFGDFTGVSDFRTALHVVMDAESAFKAMSADVRSRFSNDPAKFLDFFNNPANLDEAVKLGLVVKPEVKNDVNSGDKNQSRAPTS